MSVIIRGCKNAFRNWLRTCAVVCILAIGIGLSLSMLVANQGVDAKISELKTKFGTTITVSPAGGRGFEGGGEPLTTADATKISKIEHVVSVGSTDNFRLTNQDQTTQAEGRFGGSGQTAGKTNLVSSIEPGTLGRRFNVNANSEMPANFSMPITGVGTDGNYDASGASYSITSGRALAAADTGNVAIVGKELAAKNSLNVNSTFTAYDQTFTVVGIFDQGTKFANAGIAIPLSVAQNLNGQAGEVNSIVAQVDSADNLDSATTVVKAAMGSNADVTSSAEAAKTAIESLKSVQQITVISFFGALVAAAVIIFLIMLMIVRERKREIGVLKAIGGSNKTIVGQFIAESLVFVMLASIIGFGFTMISSGSIANALVSSNTSSTTSEQSQTARPRGGMMRFERGANSLQNSSKLVGQVATSVGVVTILYGVLATILIAIVGSAIPAWFISRISPAEVMRGE